MDQRVTPKPPRVHRVMDEILDYLATTPTATSAELREQCPSMEHDKDFSRAINNLIRDGRIFISSLIPRYRLTTPESDAQLTDALHGAAALHPATADAGDFVIRAIDRLGEPRWQEGTMHATRLRALAASPALRAGPDVTTWLVDLASIIEEMAA